MPRFARLVIFVCLALMGLSAVLLAQETLTGRTVDANGQALAEVEIRANGAQTRRLKIHASRPAQPATISSELGGFSLQSSAEAWTQLTFEAPGFVAKTVHWSGGLDTDLGEVVLQKAMSVQGRVLDEAGRGVEGARIFSSERASYREDRVSYRGEERSIAKTAADGSFLAQGLQRGAWNFLIRSEGLRDRIVFFPFDGQAKTKGLEWVLSPGRTLQGKVRGIPADESRRLVVRANFGSDSNPGDLLGGQVGGFWMLPEVAPLQPDGSFAMFGLHPEAQYELMVVEETFALDLWISQGANFTEPIRAEPAQEDVTLSWALKAGLQLRCIDANSGKDIGPPVLTSSNSDLNWALQNMPSSWSPEDGIQVQDLPVSTRGVNLIVACAGYGAVRMIRQELTAGEVMRWNSVPLQPYQFVSIDTLDGQTGTPLENVRLEMLPRSVDARGFSRLRMEKVVDAVIPELHSARAKSDAQGRARLAYVPGQRYGLQVFHPDYAPQEHAAWDPALHGDEPWPLPLSLGATVEVTLLDVFGQPLPRQGLDCFLLPSGDQNSVREWGTWGADSPSYRFFKTDSKGKVRFARLEPGEYEVSTEEESLLSKTLGCFPDERTFEIDERIVVRAGDRIDLTLRMPAQCQVEGSVTSGGKPLEGARLNRVALDHEPFDARWGRSAETDI